jgi:hypothetical protein
VLTSTANRNQQLINTPSGVHYLSTFEGHLPQIQTQMFISGSEYNQLKDQLQPMYPVLRHNLQQVDQIASSLLLGDDL